MLVNKSSIMSSASYTIFNELPIDALVGINSAGESTVTVKIEPKEGVPLSPLTLQNDRCFK